MGAQGGGRVGSLIYVAAFVQVKENDEIKLTRYIRGSKREKAQTAGNSLGFYMVFMALTTGTKTNFV